MIKKTFSYIGIFFLNFLSLLPLSILYIFADLAYYIVYYIIPYRKKVVRENLQHSFPEKPLKEIIQIEKKFFSYFMDMVFEMLKMHSISEAEINKRVRFTNLHLVEAYFNKGESALACTGHYGNWELGTMALGLNLSKLAYVIYKTVNNPIFDNWF